MNTKYRLFSFLKTIQDPSYRKWKKLTRDLIDQKFDYSTQYLSELLQFAKNKVPYYSQIIKGSYSGPESLVEIPILNRNQFRENFEYLKAKDLENRPHYTIHSGGTTGKPQIFYQDYDFFNWSLITEQYYYECFLGFDPDEVGGAILWGSPADLLEKKKIKTKISQWLKQTVFLNSYSMTQDQCREYVQVINRKKPFYIRGYAQSLYYFAKFIVEQNIKVYSPNCIISAAEKLYPFMKSTVQEAFSCPIFDYYGSRELGALAGECHENKLHIFSFNNWIEIVDDKGKPVKPGQEGKVIVTNLHNYSMPLIRYELGDTAVLGHPCSCGSNLPTLEQVTGRITEHFKTSNGSLVSGLFFACMCHDDWMEHFQVIQKDFDSLEILYKPKRQPSENNFKVINDKIKTVMGNDCHIKWKEVEAIPLSPQGKQVITKNLIAS